MTRRRHSRTRRLFAGLVLAGCTVAACSGGGGRTPPPNASSNSKAPPTDVKPSDTPSCRSGHNACVDETLGEMQRRVERLAAACDHGAVFALTYLDITKEYRRMIRDPAAFEDLVYANHLDALFARFYFSAFDSYSKGDVDFVPPAWRIAFDQSAAGRISSLGDALLGINAHINRDLPFVLDQLGIVGPDGRNRKNDFETVAIVFGRAFVPMLREAGELFDPTLAEPKLGGQTLDVKAALALVRDWRDAAFRNAERLRNAPTAQARRAITAEIESNAAVLARTLQLATTYPPSESSASRDTYCASHRA